MNFSVDKSISVWERTPRVLKSLLLDLDEEWIQKNEGADTWSPYDVIGHLIHGENTDWIERTKHILNQDKEAFTPFDRFAQFENSKGKNIAELLHEFEALRKQNIVTLLELNISTDHLKLTGLHPDFGKVTLQQLLSTWVVHDLSHLAQISRVMAKQYRNEVGPWSAYISLLAN